LYKEFSNKIEIIPNSCASGVIITLGQVYDKRDEEGGPHNGLFGSLTLLSLSSAFYDRAEGIAFVDAMSRLVFDTWSDLSLDRD